MLRSTRQVEGDRSLVAYQTPPLNENGLPRAVRDPHFEEARPHMNPVQGPRRTPATSTSAAADPCSREVCHRSQRTTSHISRCGPYLTRITVASLDAQRAPKPTHR